MDCTQGQDAVNTMTQDVFNWMARRVNKDFVLLGYPTILIKKGGRDFVSLCVLMQNCSTLMAVVRAKGVLGVSSSTIDQDPEKLSTTAAVAALDPMASSRSGKMPQLHQHPERHQKKRGGLFSSSSTRCFKQLQANNAESNPAKMPGVEAHLTQLEWEELAILYEGIVDTVRRDTEQIIGQTGCLGADLDFPAADDQHHHQQHVQLTKGQTEHYFATRWIQFKEAVIQRLLEANCTAIEFQALRPFPVKCGKSAMIIRSKSASGDTGAAAADLSSGSCDSLAYSRHSHHGRGSRQRSQSHVSITKIPSLEAEIRRLKLELTRRDQRHKEEVDRHAKEREKMTRDLQMAQRRNLLGAPRWSASSSQQVSHQQQQHHQACDCGDQAAAIPEILQALNRLAESLGGGVHLGGGSLTSSLKTPAKQQQHQAHVHRVCSTILTRVQGLQAEYNTSRKRQADLEVLISILKARLDFTNDQLSDVGKFESAVNDIAKKIVSSDSDGGVFAAGSHQSSLSHILQQGGGNGGGGGGGGSVSAAANLAQGCGDEHRDNLVSRLTSRLRERQRHV